MSDDTYIELCEVIFACRAGGVSEDEIESVLSFNGLGYHDVSILMRDTRG